MSTLELQQLRDDLRALREFVEGIRPHVERARAQPQRVRANSNVVSLDRFRSSPTPVRPESYPMTTDVLPAKARRIGPYSRAFRNALGDQFDGRSREGRFLRKVQLGLLAQLGREPPFAEAMPAVIQQRPRETHAA